MVELKFHEDYGTVALVINMPNANAEAVYAQRLVVEMRNILTDIKIEREVKMTDQFLAKHGREIKKDD